MLFAAAFTSCAQNDDIKTTATKTRISLTAGIENTRTVNPAAPVWSEDDAIGVHFAANDAVVVNNERLEGTSDNGGQTATFGGEVTLEAGNYTIYGYYPYGNAGAPSESYEATTIEIPAVQHTSATSFDPNADVMVMWPVSINHDGVSAINHSGLQFKRVLGMIKFVLTSSELNGEAIQNLTFTTDAGLELAGTAHFDLTDGTFGGFYEGAVTSVTAEPVGVYADGTDAIMICVPVMTIGAGVEMTITGETEGFTFDKSLTVVDPIELQAGDWHTMNITLEGADITPKESGPATPPDARTTDVWEVVVANGTQIWSDVINVPACDNTNFTGNGGCRKHDNSTYGFLYSRAYIDANGTTMCPGNWRVPSTDDFAALVIAFGGTAFEYGENDPAVRDRFVGPEWGGQYAGYFAGSYISSAGTQANYLSTDDYMYGGPSVLQFASGSTGNVNSQAQGMANRGYNVRCVADK